MSKFGIDVSEHQGLINWEEVKSQIDFAILRIGWIGNKNNHTLDDQFIRNYNECKRLAIPIGGYIYNYCKTGENSKNGALWCLENIQNKEFELPIYIDMEDDYLNDLSKDELTNIIYSFNYEIEKKCFKQGVYANLDWFNNKLDKEIIKKRSYTWIAHYTKGNNKYQGEFNMWQNSSTGKIKGIDGNVDTNYLYNDLFLDDTENTNLSIEELANKVIKGEYGNGEERKKALGSMYEEVQQKVNEILKNSKEYYKVCSKNETSIIDALKSINVDSSYITRKNIAEKNGIRNYSGKAVENIELLNLLKKGKLIKWVSY